MVRSRGRLSIYLLTSTALSGLSPAVAQNLPTGASVAYGSVGFQRSSGTLTINQSSQTAIVNYNSFSIGKRNTVNINQPNASSVILNRVTGNTPSTIAGRLNANGQVYLVNPNGIAITRTGVVKVGGGFVASSLGMSDYEFKHGRKHFKGNGTSAAVTNAGTITIGRGGYAALIGGTVRNRGTIAVPMGKVALGSGEMATLDVSGDGFLQVAVPTTSGGKGALVSNSGLIDAAGGTVMLDAATARAAARNAVNISGTIDAHSISGHNGSIVLGGGNGGTVNISGTLNVSGGSRTAGGSVTVTGRRIKVSGTIKASGRSGGTVTLAAANGTTITGTVKAVGRHGKGGSVTITGLKVALKGAKVNASGTTGGGSVKIGGDMHGAGPLPDAGTVTIDAKSVITADATKTGTGGSVVVLSDLSTSVAGTISAKGGTYGGTVAVNATNKVTLAETAVINASGTQGGGVVALGTTLARAEGGATITGQPTAATMLIAAGAQVSANATVAGNGGLITVLSTGDTSMAGTLSATGGASGGNGGFVEVSGYGIYSLTGAVNTAAPLGRQGTILIDPEDLLISSSGPNHINPEAGVGYATGGNASGSDYYVTPAELFALGGNVELQASRNLEVASSFTITGTVTLQAGNNLTVDSGATITAAGDITLTAANNFTGGAGQTGYSAAGSLVMNGSLALTSPAPIMLQSGTGGITLNGDVNAGSTGTLTLMSPGAISQTSGVITADTVTLTSTNSSISQSNFGYISANYLVASAGTSVTLNDSNNVGNLGSPTSTIGGSATTGFSFNHAGDLDVLKSVSGGTSTISLTAAGNLTVDASISATTVNLSGEKIITGAGSITATTLNASATGTGDGGAISLTSAQNQITKLGTISTAGPLTVTYNGALEVAGPITASAGINISTTSGHNLTIDNSLSTAGVLSLTASNATLTTQGLATTNNGAIAVEAKSFNFNGSAISSGTASTTFTVDGAATVGATGTGLDNTTLGNVTAGTLAFATTSGSNLTVEGVTLAENQVNFNSGGTLVFNTGTSTFSGSGGLNLTAAGTISESGAAISLTNASAVLTGSSSGGTTLNNSSNSFKTLGAFSDSNNGNLSLTDSTALSMTGAVNIGTGTLTLTGAGAISQTGGTVTAGTLTGSSVGGASFTKANTIAALGAFTDSGNGNLTLADTASTLTVSGALSLGTGSASISNTGATAITTPLTLTGGLTLNAAGAITDTQSLSVGAFTLTSGAWSQVASTLPSFSATNFTLNGGSFLRATGGDGSTGNPYTLTDVYGLQGVGTLQSSSFNLANNLDLSSTTYTGAVIGSFSGTFDGLGHTISNLTIVSTASDVGLIGALNTGGTVRNLGLVGGSVTGSSYVGGLVGYNNGGAIAQSYATGSVMGYGSLGGLVGYNDYGGTITQSYATGSVTGANYAGGLVGYNRGGTITQSYATGSVTGTNYAGGLVSYNNGGTITQSYATGSVSGTSYVGGLVGENEGTISLSYATGSASTTGFGFAGGLVGVNGYGGTITQSYATGRVTGSNYAGGLVGFNVGTITQSYWDTLTSGQPSSAGGTPVDTTDLAGATVLTALNGASVVWGNAGNQTTPYLLTNPGPVFLATDTATAPAVPTFYTAVLTQAGLQAINNNPSANYVLANNLNLAGTTYHAAVITGFSGIFEGLNNTISNLTIADTINSDSVGLFGTVNSGSIVRDIGLAGGSVSGTGSYSHVGGLVGYNQGKIINAYATASVTGGASATAGGLVGTNTTEFVAASITNVYATGAVSGGSYSDVGGLVGSNTSNFVAASITNAYATGAVSGGPGASVGGLAGGNAANGATASITNAYFDMATSGTTAGVGLNQGGMGSATGLTTANLQGGGATGLLGNSSAFSGGANGLYPYLTGFYPTGVQAVSGIAYTNAGTAKAASSANGAVTVNLDAGGALLAQATAGANGYYYVALPAGTVANGTSLLVSTPTNSATGAVNAATIAASTYTSGTPAQTGVNLYGGFLSTVTSALTLSAVPSFASAQSTAGGLAANDTTAAGVINALANPGYLTTGARFTVDQPYNGSGLLITTGSGDPLTVSSNVNISSGGSLGLLSGGTLTIAAPITVAGASAVNLAYDASSPTNLSFGLTASGFTGSLSFTGTNQTTGAPVGSLTINGQAYTLLNALALSGSTGPDAGTNDIAGIDNAGDGGNYALATNLEGTGATFTSALAGSGGNTFSGVFEGLGHTIMGLTITGNSNNAGLIGTLNGGGVRDIGLVVGAVSGGQDVGALVGFQVRGTITNAYTTGAVSGSSTVGGLVGFQPSGTITNAYATGAVSGGMGSSDVGGLVGGQGGTITNAYATGAVLGGQRSSDVGGLVGSQGVVSITTNAYATGAVSGSSHVGGLVGFQDGGTITNAYATGAVSGSSDVGGLVGVHDGTITNAYYDTLTTGQGGAGTGLNTSNFQTAAAAANLGAAFSGGTGLYPYLTSFYPNGVQAISGTAETSAGTAASGAQVAVYSGGALLTGTMTSAGANGYFYEIVPAGTLATSNVKIGAALTLLGASTVSGLLYTDAGSVSNNVLALGTVKSALNAQTTAETTYSTLQTDLGTTFGSSALSALNTALAATATSIDATDASFTIDTSVSPGGNFAVATSATDAPLTVAASSPVAGAGTVTLSATGNITLDAGVSASAGTVSISSSGGTLTTSSAAAVSATGNVTLTAVGNVAIGSDVASSGGNTGLFATGSSANLTLNGGTISAGSGETVVLSAAGAFINTDSAGAVTTPTNGQWLIYSANPSGDTFDSLNSANTAIWGTSAATSLSSATVSASGDRYVFALSPTLTITTTNDTKTYGQTTTTNGLSSDYTITGLEAGVSGAYLGDAAASVYSGAPAVSSSGVGASANVGGGGGTGGAYAITALATGLTIGDGYNATSIITNNGLLTVNPAPLSVTGLSGTNIVYANTMVDPLTGTAALSGTVYASNVSLSGGTTATGAFADPNVGTGKAVTVSGLGLTGLGASNYALSVPTLSANITAAPLSVTGLSGTNIVYANTMVDPLTGTAALSGTVYASNVSLSGGTTATGAFADPDVGTGKAVTVSGLGLTGPGASNYALSVPTLSANITAAPLSVTGLSGTNIVYANTMVDPLTGTAALSGTVYASNVSLSGGTTATGAFADPDVGTGKAVTVSGLGLTGLGASNYALSVPTLSANITAAPLSVTGLSGTNIVYANTMVDPLTGTAALSGTVYASNVSLSGGTTATGAFADPNVGTGKAVTVSGLGLTGPGASNYALSVPTLSANITAAPLSVTGLSGTNIVYANTMVDPLTGAAALSGTVYASNVSLSGGTTATGAFADPDVGTGKAVTVSGLGLTGPGASNYALSVPTLSANITAAPLSVTGLSGTNIVYANTMVDPLTGAAALSGTVYASNVSLSGGTTATGAFADPDVGTGKAVTVSGLGLTGPGASNYALSVPTLSANITPAALTYLATAATATYGSTPTGLSGTVTGFVNGQTVANATTGTLAFTTTATAASNVGSYAINGSGLTADNGNYTFTQAAGNSTALTINPAVLTYNATAATSTYGSTPTGLTGTVTGFVNGQTVANATTGTLAFTTTATAASNVSSYAITGSGLTANNGNYTFAQAAGNSTALTVNPALLSVSGLKTYDATTGFATGQLAVAGAQNGETVALTQGSGTTASANAGTYAGSTLSNFAIAVTGGNAMASNYTLPGTGTLTIGQATITVAGASGVNKTYDATTALPNGATGFTTSGVIGTNATVSATSAQYASANAGPEPVTVAGLTISGAAAGDYVLSSNSVTGSGTISPASVTVTANGGSSIYGQTPVNPGLSAAGMQGGQPIAVLTGLSNSFGITGQSNAGAYTLTVQGALTNANYAVAAANTGTFTVAQRALAIVANNGERAAAVANPPLTYQVGATTQTTGLVNGDGLTGALTTSATAASPAGAYAISQGTLAAWGNYVVSFTPGTLTIEPAAVVPVMPTPVMPTLTVDLSATLLASTANRAFEQVDGDVSNALPFVFSSLSGDGSYASQLVAGLGNPRFDRIIVCAKNVCTLVPPLERKPQKTSQLESPAQ